MFCFRLEITVGSSRVFPHPPLPSISDESNIHEMTAEGYLIIYTICVKLVNAEGA